MTDGRPTRWASRQIDRHANTILFILLVISLIAATWAALGWKAARDAQRRLTTVEAVQQAEELGKKIADVTTCFNQAKNRPKLTLVLRAIAMSIEPHAQSAANSLLDDYQDSTPGTADCIALANKTGIDPAPYLKHPPSSAGQPAK